MSTNIINISIVASSFKTFGMIILESIASIIHFAYSEISSMNEVIKNNCEYFIPKNSDSIQKSVEKLMIDKNLRMSISKKAQKETIRFSSSECSGKTFNFIFDSIRK